MGRETDNRKGRLVALVLAGALLIGIAAVVKSQHDRQQSAQPPAVALPPSPLALPPAGLTPSLTPPPQQDTAEIDAIRQQLQRRPRDRTARYRLAHLYFQRFDYSHALQELDVLEKDDPRDAEVHLRKAVVFKYDGEPDAAEREARRALALKPEYDLARQLLGEVHLDQGRYQDALKVFEKYLQGHPEDYAALLGKGRALERLYLAQHPVKVAAMFAPVEKAVQLQPDNPQGLMTLARMKFAYLNTEKAWTEAEQAADRAAELDPQNPQPYITLGQIYLARPATAANLDKAGEYAAKAGTLDLQDPRPPYLLGRVSLLKNDVDRAIRALELSIRLRPMAEAVTQLAVAYRRAGNKERADRYARLYQQYMDRIAQRDALMAAREREPREPRHYYALARLYLDAGQPASAEAWLERARSVRAEDPARDALLARAEALKKKGGNGPLLPIP